MKSRLLFLTMMFCLVVFHQAMSPAVAKESQNLVRFATFNASMYRNYSGQLVRELRGGNDQQARKIAEIIQRTRPDVLLVNEFDYDNAEEAAQLFCSEYLQVGQNGQPPVLYPYFYSAPVNTGVPTNLDLDQDGKSDQPNDAFGFGRHPGQYGMLLLSRFPIQTSKVRTFQKFLWKDMPDNLLPVLENTGNSYYSTEARVIFRLSSKSHWDIPIKIDSNIIHVLAAHPTPPSFDGPEKRNQRRNHDEIRLWADYVDPMRSDYLYDDDGVKGGLQQSDKFVIMGDYNADPFDGTSVNRAINQLLEHSLVNSTVVPVSNGAIEAAQEYATRNRNHRGPSVHDTANFSDASGPGNLRVDYVLPSKSVNANNAGTFWPVKSDRASHLISASDHHLVWLEIILDQ